MITKGKLSTTLVMVKNCKLFTEHMEYGPSISYCLPGSYGVGTKTKYI